MLRKSWPTRSLQEQHKVLGVMGDTNSQGITSCVCRCANNPNLWSSAETQLESYSRAYMNMEMEWGQCLEVQVGIRFSSMRVELKCQEQQSCKTPLWHVTNALKGQEVAQVCKSAGESAPALCASTLGRSTCRNTQKCVVPAVLHPGSLQSSPGSCSVEITLHWGSWAGEHNAAVCCLRKRFTGKAAALVKHRNHVYSVGISSVLNWSMWESNFLNLFFNHGRNYSLVLGN